MPCDEAVTRWLRQLETGDQNAARHLWQRYYQQVVELARARLGTMPRRVVDEEDVALSVLRSLYEGAATGQYTSLVSRQELWQLLAAITVRKVIDHQRMASQLKRGGGKVRGDSVFKGEDANGSLGGFDAILGDAVTPEALSIAAEEYRRLMALLEDDRLRQIVQFKLEGYANQEIAERLGLTRRSIERKLQRVRESWEGEVRQ